jgi:hypothetical protein
MANPKKSILDYRYDEVSFKASHNSYAREERPVTTQLRWNSKEHHQCGCQGLEIDICQSPDLWLWSVGHFGPYNGSTDKQLSEYLAHLRRWSDRQKRHSVITITLDIKGEVADLRSFPLRLDEYIQRHIGIDKLFTPRELQRGAGSLVEGAIKYGWPTLRDLQSKFVLCLSGHKKAKVAYARSGANRLCFADQKLAAGDPVPSRGNHVFMNMKVESDDDWRKRASRVARRRGIVSRGYVINNEDLWQVARKSGINILATDKVRRYKWATVGKSPFVRRSSRPN